MAVLRTGPTESLIQGLHQSVFRAEKRIGLVLFGKGNIGSRWLELFAREQSTLSARTGFEFVLAGVVDSRRSLLSYDGLDASRALAFFNDEAVEQDEESLFLWMRAHPYDDLVVLDVTASQQLADQYLDFASHGFHVISANKLAGASDSNKYRQIHDAFEKTGRHWLYNATVGAGLPINHTVRDLIDSGDTILSISGIFSGTLSWLFLQFDGSVPFTELVDQAWQQGLTEPDPRDDLSGKDVMRKLVILAREAGYNIEPDQVRVESLVPAHCEGGSIDHFFENGDELNEQMVQRLEAAREMGLVLRYVARFDANGKARVGVEAVREDHPLASLLPCDNVFAIESRWYRDNPLVIRGPGAGRDVTAGAIQSTLPFALLMLVVIVLATFVSGKRAQLPALLAHAGVLLFAAGIVVSSVSRQEISLNLQPGQQVTLAGYTFRFERLDLQAKGNYTSEKAIVALFDHQQRIGELTPERRFYEARRQQMMEPSIRWNGIHDWYAVMGEKTGADRYAFRLYVQSGVRWIWGGGLLMIAGALLSGWRGRKRDE